jgi:acetyl esterase/lipase
MKMTTKKIHAASMTMCCPSLASPDGNKKPNPIDDTMTRRFAHAINTLCVVLPLVHLWSIAKFKNMLLAEVSLPFAHDVGGQKSHSFAYVAIVILILLVASSLVAKMIYWSRIRHYDFKDALKDLHRFVRDSGVFYTLMEFISLQHALPILLKYPCVIWWMFQASRRRKVITYGKQSASQKVDLFLPSPEDSNHQVPARGLLVFVHGGAWGSGSPAQYSMIAKPFLRINWAVAVVGYRVYPEGDVTTQILDVEMAAAEVIRLYPDLNQGNVCLFGHSSGAHVCMLSVVERARRELELSRTLSPQELLRWRLAQVNFDSVIGMSGPYNILHHYDYESARGVEQISPMAPANGHSSEMFLRFSPAVQFHKVTCQCKSEIERQVLQRAMPPTTLIHGRDDNTVPCSSTEEAARLMNSTDVTVCKEIYLEDTGHEGAILQVMFGGPVQDILIGLLQHQ